MLTPNPHTFPLVAYPGPPPESAPRHGMGGWGGYALASPAGYLPPFVLARPTDPAGSRWVNCARLEDAATGAVLATLTPTGTNPGSLGLLLEKYPDTGNGLEYFAYTGALVPGLTAVLPCGVPCRLVLDNDYQSPAFVPITNAADYLLLEWSHPAPLAGVPYGAGLTQRLYVAGAALAYIEPRTERSLSKDPDSGGEHLDFAASWARRTVATEPLPAFLAEALALLPQHALLEVDGAPWRPIEAKPVASGPDGGRHALALTLEGLTPAITRACSPPAPVPAAYDPAADAPRPWRCGMASDTAPDYQPLADYTCEADAGGYLTGYALYPTTDINPYSTTAGQSGPARRRLAIAQCPVPPTYPSARVVGFTPRNDCPTGQVAADTVFFDLPAGSFTSRASQAAADALATAYYATAAQANANTHGTCWTGGPVQWVPYYGDNACFTCQMANLADAGDVRAATSAEISLYFRNYGVDPNTGQPVACPDCL